MNRRKGKEREKGLFLTTSHQQFLGPPLASAGRCRLFFTLRKIVSLLELKRRDAVLTGIDIPAVRSTDGSHYCSVRPYRHRSTTLHHYHRQLPTSSSSSSAAAAASGGGRRGNPARGSVMGIIIVKFKK